MPHLIHRAIRWVFYRILERFGIPLRDQSTGKLIARVLVLPSRGRLRILGLPDYQPIRISPRFLTPGIFQSIALQAELLPFPDEPACLAAEKSLQAHGVIPRRYFYPAVDSYAICRKSAIAYDSEGQMNNSESAIRHPPSAIRAAGASPSAISHSPSAIATQVALRILCLPLYWKLAEDDIRRIAGILIANSE